MSGTSETIMVTAHCLCKAHTYTTSVPRSKLPLEATACHCNSCRHVTGAMFSTDAPWPEPRANVNTSKLQKYPFSPRISILFCGTCSTPLFFEDAEPPHELGVFTGALTNSNVDLVKFKNHIYVGDTVDGGASMSFLRPNADGSEAKRFENRAGTGEEYLCSWPPVNPLTSSEKKAEETVPIRCHCKGIDFVLHSANYKGKNPEDVPFYIDPAQPDRRLASFCACDSCRLHTGSDVVVLTFAELKDISIPTEENNSSSAFPQTTAELKAAVDRKGIAMGTLAYYCSSPDVQRYFCSRCSATVFYAVDERPDMVDVWVGLLEDKDGGRAESFLAGPFAWVGKEGDVKGGWREGLVERVKEGTDVWRKERGLQVRWKNRPVE
ncbi:hypothetical protein GQ43DRAFT_166785 [Delitschia confertaspora ATCC 74209]|uniref:CENP-V/GFA domain-containing protein n=1 Tax=Delitschia confertaspora ATCC 74209 TaxID=1513339 RepID=A0A9P4MVT5_9PLEO|nr:hypothetical protein GQ43DRAFT_166785 [Delitschia confertaspora ATCC 74209]